MILATGVPTILRSAAPRNATSLLQRQLEQAQVEMTTGRHHDLGLVLGARTGTSVSLRLQIMELEQGMAAVAGARSRAELTQSSLNDISKIAGTFLEVLTGARGAIIGQQIAADAARSALGAMSDLLNISYDGTFLFGGLNSQIPPLNSYDGGPAQSAVNNAFQRVFGFTQADAAVNDIASADMSAFLDYDFAPLFDSTNWTLNWSNASSVNVLAPLVGEQRVDSAVNLHADFASRLAQAFTMMMDLGQSQLNSGAFEVVVDRAMSLILEAQDGLGREQSRMGIAQQRLSAAMEDYDMRKYAVLKAMDQLESVDPYEAATKVNSLMTQLEASYTLTGRISRMSILNYI